MVASNSITEGFWNVFQSEALQVKCTAVQEVYFKGDKMHTQLHINIIHMSLHK